MENNKVFIGGLNYSTTEDSLRQELSKFGLITSIRIVTDYDSGKSKGFGFATFENEDSAAEAIKNLNNQIFEGRRIGVKYAVDKKR